MAKYISVHRVHHCKQDFERVRLSVWLLKHFSSLNYPCGKYGATIAMYVLTTCIERNAMSTYEV